MLCCSNKNVASSDLFEPFWCFICNLSCCGFRLSTMRNYQLHTRGTLYPGYWSQPWDFRYNSGKLSSPCLSCPQLVFSWLCNQPIMAISSNRIEHVKLTVMCILPNSFGYQCVSIMFWGLAETVYSGQRGFAQPFCSSYIKYFDIHYVSWLKTVLHCLSMHAFHVKLTWLECWKWRRLICLVIQCSCW